MRLHLDKVKSNNFAAFDSFDQFLRDKQRQPTLEELSLTNVYVQGKRHKAKRYIRELPYAKRMINHSVRLEKLAATHAEPKHVRMFSQGDVSLNLGPLRQLNTSPGGNRTADLQMGTTNLTIRSVADVRRRQPRAFSNQSLRSNPADELNIWTEESLNPVILESENDSGSGEEDMTEAELIAINLSLREEVESKVFVFEQYLKVAML